MGLDEGEGWQGKRRTSDAVAGDDVACLYTPLRLVRSSMGWHGGVEAILYLCVPLLGKWWPELLC